MEHYPEVDRRDGTLFFIPNGDRAAIAISIERLIDLLDAAEGDPDLEANGDEADQAFPEGWRHSDYPLEDDEPGTDDEPSLGAEERHPHVWGSSLEGDQTYWAYGIRDEREDDGDDLEPDNDAEYSHGWTGNIDQTLAPVGGAFGDDGGEGEPDLGWSGHGTGWRNGDDPRALEGSERTEDDGPLDIVGDASLYGYRSLGVDPTLLPDEFNCTCEGDCLEPLVADGARLHFDKRLPLRFDQLVMIVRKPGSYPAGDHQAVVKRLVADLRGVPWLGWEEGGVLAEMLHPRQVLFYPAHTVSAVIACTGPASDEIGPTLTAGDILARRAQILAQGRQAC